MIEDFPANEVEFDRRFHTEKACLDYLFQLRWPEGFSCPHCGHTEYWISARGLYLCRQCERQQSVTAGTIFMVRESRSRSGLKPSGGSQLVRAVSVPQPLKTCLGWAVIKQHGAGFKSYGHALSSLTDPSCPAPLKLTNSILAACTVGSVAGALGTSAKWP